MTAEDLAAAARWLDDNSGGIDSVNRILGVATDDAAYIAKQRALRLVLMMRGKPLPNKTAGFVLDEEEELLLKLMSATEMDGLAIGLAASKGLSAPIPSTTSNN